MGHGVVSRGSSIYIGFKKWGNSVARVWNKLEDRN